MAGGTPPPRLALLGVLACALLAAASGLDRASAHDPALARLVPRPFAAEAHRASAAQALLAGHGEQAIEAARRAVGADPVYPRSTALLGAAHLAVRHPAPADRAFRIAARMGWRDPLTQIYLMDRALTAGQPELAALRLDAVLRHDPGFALRDMLIARLLDSPGGQAALASRLVLRPAWAPSFMGSDSALPLPVLQQRARLVIGFGGKRWGWGCGGVAPLASQLVRAGDVPTAKTLWLAQCPQASTGIADPHFRAVTRARPPVPFEWNLGSSGDLAAGRHPVSGLLARVSGAVAQPAAWQVLTLPPGRYSVRWRVVGPAGTAALSFSCALDVRRPLPARHHGPDGWFEAELLADGGCPGQFLALWLTPGREDTWFDGAEILLR